MLCGERLAVTTGSMDRLEHLLQAMNSWTKLAEPDEIIVVDWGSSDPLALSLASFGDPRVTVVRAEASHWENSRCHNLEFTAASHLECDLVLRLDNDALVAPDFFRHHPPNDTSFYAVNCHSVPPETDDKRNLCGTVFTAVRHWRRVNGYNERLRQYGFEDEDFYCRLAQAGLTWRECLLGDLEHLPHDDGSRLEHIASHPLLSPVDPHVQKQFRITLSRQIAIARPWTSSDLRTRWNLTQPDPDRRVLVASEQP